MNAVSFDCGDCITLNPGESVRDVIDAHAGCGECEELAVRRLQDRIDTIRQRGHAARQKKWEARVDAELTEAKETA